MLSALVLLSAPAWREGFGPKSPAAGGVRIALAAQWPPQRENENVLIKGINEE
jgi:hypothetical protein